jgi:hypothetical protein
LWVQFPSVTLIVIRSVAQLVEHRSPKPAVGGSSPSGPVGGAVCCSAVGAGTCDEGRRRGGFHRRAWTGAVSSRGLGRSPLKAQTRVRIPLPLCWESGTGTRGVRPYRLSVRTPPFHGGETGSIPVGAMQEGQCAVDRVAAPRPIGTVAQLVRVPVCHTGGRGFEPRQSRSRYDVDAEDVDTRTATQCGGRSC